MPPPFCIGSASDQCHAIPHENHRDTPTAALDSCVPAKPLWLRLGSRCCLRVPCEAPLSPSEVTGAAQLQLSIFWRPVQSCFSKLLARQYTHPKSLPPSS